MKNQIYRHGEIAFLSVDKLPENLTKSDEKVLIKGQNGHSHSIDNGILYFVNEDMYVFGYLVAQNTSLLHDEHGVIVDGQESRFAKLPDGVYQLRKQQEYINNEMKPVVD